MLIGESQRLDIPCIGTGTLLTDLAVPTVCEDGVAGGAMAVRHLVEHGHRRIGFIQIAFSMRGSFIGIMVTCRGCAKLACLPNDCFVLWLRPDEDHQAALTDYFARSRVSAVRRQLRAAAQPGAARARGEHSRARDVAIISFDQHPESAAWLGGVKPTIVELPLREMGRRLAQMARAIVDGKEVARTTTLPCTLSHGASVEAATRASVGVSGGPLAAKPREIKMEHGARGLLERNGAGR